MNTTTRVLTGFLCAGFFGIGSANAAPSDAQAMFQTATGFYGVYQSLHPSDGIPDAKLRARFEPFISPALDKLLADGEAAEARYKTVTKNQSPPLVEGDLFTPNFEGATSLRIGACVTDAKANPKANPEKGHCPVAVVYDDGKDKPLRWTDTVIFVHMDGGWRIDDIAYGSPGGDFASRGSVTRTINDAIKDGASVPN